MLQYRLIKPKKKKNIRILRIKTITIDFVFVNRQSAISTATQRLLFVFRQKKNKIIL